MYTSSRAAVLGPCLNHEACTLRTFRISASDDLPFDRQTDRQTARQTDRQTDRQQQKSWWYSTMACQSIAVSACCRLAPSQPASQNPKTLTRVVPGAAARARRGMRRRWRRQRRPATVLTLTWRTTCQSGVTTSRRAAPTCRDPAQARPRTFGRQLRA